MATTIVLADDHAVVRSGLKLLLEGEEDFEVVALAGTADDALRYVRGHKPDVLILDLNMPGARKSLDVIPEVDVLGLIALGHTNSEIAEQLHLSVRTVETHRAHIQQKLRLSARAELVRYALERGLVKVPPSP